MKRTLCILFVFIITVLFIGETRAQLAASDGLMDAVTVEDIYAKLEAIGVTDATVDFNVRITIPKGKNPCATKDVDLWATVIRPAAAKSKKLPAIVTATPYRRENMISYPELVKNDYVYIVVDIRGSGSSEGIWASFDLLEQYDIKYVIDEWIPSQEWSDGTSGMIGASYMGIIQMLVAGIVDRDQETGEPDHLKAIFPLIPMSDAYRDIVMHGGNVDLEFIPMWLGGVDIMALMPSLLEQEDDPALAGEIAAKKIDSIRQLGITVGWILDADHIADGPFYDRKSPMAYWPVKPEGGWGFNEGDTMTIPTGLPVLTTGGWFDIFTRGTLNNFQYGLSEHGNGDKVMIIGEWYHGTAAMGIGLDAFKNSALPIRWFDWKIKGKDDPFLVDYPVLIYVMGADRWRAEKSWPLPESRVENKTLYLSRVKQTPIPGDWFTAEETNQIYSLVETPGPDDFIGDEPVLLHAQGQPLHGYSSRSNERWIAGMNTIEAQISKLELGVNIDEEQWFEDDRDDDWRIPTFTTAPLDEDMEITGPLLISFWAKTKFQSPSAELISELIATKIKFMIGMDENLIIDLMNDRDVQWIIELDDVFPNGRARNITSGWLRASHRPYDPAESIVAIEHPIDPLYKPFDPFYQGPDRKPIHINENELYQYTVELWPTSNIFKKGHRIRVTISASDFPHLLPIMIPSSNTIVIDQEHPATLDFTSVNGRDEGSTWKWVDNPDEYLLGDTDGSGKSDSMINGDSHNRHAEDSVGGCGSAAEASSLNGTHGSKTAGTTATLLLMIMPCAMVMLHRSIRRRKTTAGGGR
jgi:uncharacterized protein